MPSLIEKWHPVTHDFGLIKAPIEPVLAELLNWHGCLGIKDERTEIASSLADALASLLPFRDRNVAPVRHHKLRLDRLFPKQHSGRVCCARDRGVPGNKLGSVCA